MIASAAYWIEKLGLKPHPEGGHYLETFRSSEKVTNSSGQLRSSSTTIYYLLQDHEISKLHRIKSDEVWHFYAGNALTIPVFHPEGNFQQMVIGPENIQAVVPAGCWFGAYLAGEKGYALAGCSVAPGFEFEDLEFADTQQLLRQFPAQASTINLLSRA